METTPGLRNVRAGLRARPGGSGGSPEREEAGVGPGRSEEGRRGRVCGREERGGSGCRGAGRTRVRSGPGATAGGGGGAAGWRAGLGSGFQRLDA